MVLASQPLQYKEANQEGFGVHAEQAVYPVGVRYYPFHLIQPLNATYFSKLFLIGNTFIW